MNKWVFISFVLAACRSAPLPGEGITVEERSVVPRCGSMGAACKTSEECCDGYCEKYLVYSPDYETCRPLLPDGRYCNYDRECRGGRCLDSECVSASCSSRCAEDADCCAGFYCSTWSSYGPDWNCEPQGGIGEVCIADSSCHSQHCVNHKCE